MKRLLVFITVIFPVYLAAQIPVYYTASVTQLRAEVRNNFIRLIWLDSPEMKGTVYIYRSARPFIDAIPANIRPVPVNYGTQYYIDDVDDMDNLYYFIAASDPSGKRFDTVIPGVNSIGVFTGDAPDDAPVQTQTQIPIPLNQGIINLKAVKDNDRIIITFNISGPAKNAVLYRSMLPVVNVQDLISAVVVQTGVRSPYVDFPIPGIRWYYAVLFEDEVSGGNINIRSGYNSTLQPVIISASDTAQVLRPIPLPYISASNDILGNGGAAEIINLKPLKNDTEKTLDSVKIYAKEPFVKKTPRIFKVDADPPSDGQESLLNMIVHEYFVRQDWENARIALINYLSLPRSRELQARARFYLGQSFYFSDLYREALFEFLSIQNDYSAEANSWLESVLAAIVH
jgi:hypothetical protein